MKKQFENLLEAFGGYLDNWPSRFKPFFDNSKKNKEMIKEYQQLDRALTNLPLKANREFVNNVVSSFKESVEEKHSNEFRWSTLKKEFKLILLELFPQKNKAFSSFILVMALCLGVFLNISFLNNQIGLDSYLNTVLNFSNLNSSLSVTEINEQTSFLIESQITTTISGEFYDF